jgi:hypothetical protein
MTVLIDLCNALFEKRTQQEVLDRTTLEGLSFAKPDDIESISNIFFLLTNRALRYRFLYKMSGEQLKQLGQFIMPFSKLLFVLRGTPEIQLRLLTVLDEDTLRQWPLHRQGRQSPCFISILQAVPLHSGLLISKLSPQKLAELVPNLEDLARVLGVLKPESQKILLDRVKEHINLSTYPLDSKPLANQWFALALVELSPQLKSNLLSQIGYERCISLLNQSRQEQREALTDKLLCYLVPASWTLEKWFYSSSRMNTKKEPVAYEVDESFTQNELVQMKLINRRQIHQRREGLDFFSTRSESCLNQPVAGLNRAVNLS